MSTDPAGQQQETSGEAGARLAIHQAIGVVSAVCDYAKENDGRGFNAVDAWLGHVLAEMPAAAWTSDTALAAWDMLRKYRGQLAGAGIDYDRLPRPEGADELEAGRREQSRERARERARQWRDEQYRKSRTYLRCDGDGQDVVLAFPYDPDLVAACRKIDGRRYDGAAKSNTYPFTSLPAVIAFAEANGIEVTADVRALAAIAAGRAAERAAQPQVRLDQASGAITIDATLSPALYEALKEANNGQSAWDLATRVFRLPVYLAGNLQGLAEQAGLRVSDEARAAIRAHASQQEQNRADASAFEADPVPVPGLASGLTLKPQQYPVVRFALRHRRVLIGDDMGWGKTLSSLAAAAADGAYPAVVVCRPSLTLNWVNEIRRFFPRLNVFEASGTTPQPVPPGADVIVIGSAALAARPRKTTAGGKEFGWVEALKTAQPRALIVDEGQDTKERAANRSQACEQLAAGVIARDGLVLDLTGTAILNRPRELCQQLTMLGRIGEFGGPKRFLWRYCLSDMNRWGASYHGARNLIELHDRLRAWGIMIRRADDAALGLPPCREHVLVIGRADLDPEVMQRYRKAEADLLEFLADQARETAERLGQDPASAAVEAAMRAAAAEHLVAINTLRQLAGQAKRGHVTRWVRARVDAGEKVMVAAHHRPEVDAYAGAFGGLRLQGGQTVAEKEAAKAAFQQQPAAQAPVISVAIGAGGVGHTLTAARIGIQAEQAWTPGETQQMKKRLHRIGQDRAVDYYITVAEGTIDEQLRAVVTAKQATLDAVLDGRSDSGAAADEASVAAELTWRLTQQGLRQPPTGADGSAGEAAAVHHGVPPGTADGVPALAAAGVPGAPQTPGDPATGTGAPAMANPGTGPAQSRVADCSGSEEAATDRRPEAAASAGAPGRRARAGADQAAVAAQRALKAGGIPAADILCLIQEAAALDPSRSGVWDIMRAQLRDRDAGAGQLGRWARRQKAPLQPGACRHCGSAHGQRGDCPPVTCLACGSRQCGDTLGGRCIVCHNGMLHPFDRLTGEPLACGYSGCEAPAVAEAPRVGRVCGGHLDRVTVQAQGTWKKTLADWVQDKIAERDIGGPDLTWTGPGGPAPAARFEAREIRPGDRVYTGSRWRAITSVRAESLGRVVLIHDPEPALLNEHLTIDRVDVRAAQRFWVHRPATATSTRGGTAAAAAPQPSHQVTALGTGKALEAGLCAVSGAEMAIIMPGQTAHPCCEDDTAGVAAPGEGTPSGMGTGDSDSTRLPALPAGAGDDDEAHALVQASPPGLREPAHRYRDDGLLPVPAWGAQDGDGDEGHAEARISPRRLRESAYRYLEEGLLPVPAWAARANGECCCPRAAGCDRPGKHPRAVRSGPGPRDYSWRPLTCSTPAEVDERFADDSPYAAGNLMVAISEGMMAIDRDDDDGGRAAAAALAGKLGDLPPTLSHKTPHGEHLIYRTPPGWKGRAWVGKAPGNPVPAGIDLRMPGQILMAAPSVVPGPDGAAAAYGPVTGAHVAALPAAYLAAWTPSQPQPRRPAQPVAVPPDSAGRAARYVHDAMTHIAGDLAAREPGGRNAAAYAAGLKAGSLLGAARATPGAEHAAWTDEQAEQVLLDAAERNGYAGKDGHAEALRAIRSGLRNGLRSPRTLPDFTATQAAPASRPHPWPAAAAPRSQRDSQAPEGPARPARPAGRWQDLVPDAIRRKVEAADSAAAARRRAAIAAHHHAIEQHDRASTARTAAEVARTAAEAHAAHQEYTRDGRHVTGRHDAAMLRWAAAIAAQREQDPAQPAPSPGQTAPVQASRAAMAANEAYKAGNLDLARELTEQAAALDPSRAGLWQQHRNDIAARRLILAAKAAHAEGDHEHGGKFLQDARQLDPRLRTLWDGSLPTRTAAKPARQAPGPADSEPTSRPAATAQAGEGTPQRAWPSAPARQEPGHAGPATAPSGGTQPAAQRPAREASPREPRAAAPASAEDPDTDPDDAAARWPSPNPRSHAQPGVPARAADRETRKHPQAPAEGARNPATPGAAPPADWRDQVLSEAHQRWQPGPSWPHNPAIHRTPEAAAPDTGIPPCAELE